MNESKSSLWALLYKYKAHHILLWTLYFLFWILMYGRYYPSIWGIIVVTGVYFVFNAAAFYVTCYYFFPRFLYKQKYGSFFLWSGTLVVGLSLGLALCLFFLFKGLTDEFPHDYVSLLQYAFMAIATMLGLLSGVKLVADRIRTDRINRTRDKQRLESELQYLKAQVNPHFLFNAINSVYFLIKKNPDHAAETLIKLSDLLRFQLYDCSEEKIAIEKEIEYLNNFIALEKIRRGEKVKVHLEQEGTLSGFQIAPFLLIPFFENAFKYVSNFSKQDNTICITMKREGDLFTANVTNTTDNVVKNGVGGIGLKNVQRRLELLYPEKHQLLIQDEDGRYSVHLAITIA